MTTQEKATLRNLVITTVSTRPVLIKGESRSFYLHYDETEEDPIILDTINGGRNIDKVDLSKMQYVVAIPATLKDLDKNIDVLVKFIERYDHKSTKQQYDFIVLGKQGGLNMNTVKFIKSMGVLDEILDNFLSLSVIEGEDEPNTRFLSKSEKRLVRSLFAIANEEVSKAGLSVIDLIQKERNNLVFNTSPELTINWSKKGYSYILTISPRALFAPFFRMKKVEYTFYYDYEGFSKQTSFVTLYR